MSCHIRRRHAQLFDPPAKVTPTPPEPTAAAADDDDDELVQLQLRLSTAEKKLEQDKLLLDSILEKVSRRRALFVLEPDDDGQPDGSTQVETSNTSLQQVFLKEVEVNESRFHESKLRRAAWNSTLEKIGLSDVPFEVNKNWQCCL